MPPPGTILSSTAARVACWLSSKRSLKWLDDLADRRAAERIAQRIVRLQSGLIGDAKPVGGGISEIRIDHGPGYRVYFLQRRMVLIVLLCGGDKRSQSRDIVRARTLAEELEDD
jgi:putative addiction module killer protein